MDNINIGRKAEDVVMKVFERHGFQLMMRNYRVHGLGELDLVMTNSECLAIVEVKSRKIYNRFGGAIYAIHPLKRSRILITTIHFLQHHRLDYENVYLFAGCVTHNKAGDIEKVRIIKI